jgi:hypothetical protein
LGIQRSCSINRHNRASLLSVYRCLMTLHGLRLSQCCRESVALCLHMASQAGVNATDSCNPPSQHDIISSIIIWKPGMAAVYAVNSTTGGV